MTIKKTMQRLAAGTGALALAMAGAVAMGTAASAAVGPDQPEAPESGSLTIHKYNANQEPASDGTEQDVDGTPLGGVKFTIWQLGIEGADGCEAIDLTNTNAWTDDLPTAGAPATLAAVEAAGFCLVDPTAGTTLTTNEDGQLTFPNLDISLYYVQETDSSGAYDADGPVTVVSQAAPFYVTIPLANDGDWIYDVHAYPKNQVLDAPVKVINETEDQDGLTVGDTVEFTISQTVPKLNEGESYKSASIWDNMGTSFGYDATATLTLNGTPLVEGTDYEIVTSGALVTWKLTGALDDIKAGDVLAVTFTAKVLEVTETGEIGNPGSTDPEKPGYGAEFNGTPGPEGPTPYTYWGQLKVTKVDQDKKPLVGAEFKVTAKGAEACAAEVGDQEVVSTGLSGADGVVTWDFETPASSPLDLFVANSNDGPLTDASKDYCLYETKVPAGYTAVPISNPITITPGTTLTVDVNDLTIENVQKDVPDLPLTGAQGTLAMTIGGLLLVGVGTGAIVVSRRRRNSAV